MDLPAVRLRPVAESDVDLFLSVENDPSIEGRYSWAGFTSAAHWRRRYEETDGFLEDDLGRLIVLDDAEASAGWVSWHVVQHGPGPASQAYNIGIVLLPSARGRGIGAAAQRALADYLFTTTAVERVEASTAVDNVAEQRSLERAGFTREGVLRRSMFVGGHRHDSVLFSLLRGE